MTGIERFNSRNWRRMWQPFFASDGEWHWRTGYMPNGWMAVVMDRSQAVRPVVQTRYTASAMSNEYVVYCPLLFESFEEARDVAIDIATWQGDEKTDGLTALVQWEEIVRRQAVERLVKQILSPAAIVSIQEADKVCSA